MGADMIGMTLYLENGELDIEKGVSKMRQCLLAETDPEVIEWAAEYVDCVLDELPQAVVDADPEAHAAWIGKIAEGYRDKLKELELSFDSREVWTNILGPITCYFTGGMTFGDDPSESYTLWSAMFHQQQDPGWGNPYADELYDALIVQWNPQWVTAGATVKMAQVTLGDFTAPEKTVAAVSAG